MRFCKLTRAQLRIGPLGGPPTFVLEWRKAAFRSRWPPRSSIIMSGSTPTLRPSAIASAMAAVLTMTRRLLTNLILLAEPKAPRYRHTSAKAGLIQIRSNPSHLGTDRIERTSHFARCRLDWLAGHRDGVSGLVAAVSVPLGGCASD